ncbi:MAG: fused MFS/spermidine synthase [Candidatus Accumulibacter sp.]|jgi:predicted membrane-bound spermidine synthase|nr:fused MFS/spermidine synthase [Accumulibacter sp.]
MPPLSPKSSGRALLLLFILSGLAGLIYQSVWSQYLGLTLGHAAYAQTLVLSIFMGGMALGAWFISRRSRSWYKLIRGYAWVELLIGALGLAFQGIFQGYTHVSQESILPLLDNAALAHAYQWASAALLILPQSFLLGATFPLLSAGYLRIAPRQDGEVLGGLYFTNSLGAALGALAATFALLPALGLPGTVMTAGALNILVGLGAWLVSRMAHEGQSAPAAAPPDAATDSGAPQNSEIRRITPVMLAATAISGATSFVYEIGWVRMLNQALGSSLHSFELMLTAFILGLAFGGLWIRRRASRIADPIAYVGYAQVFMGMAALLSIPVFAQSFHWVGWIMEGLARTENGYTLFEMGTALISLAVMFPAAFFAGMTLPLFTMALLRAGADERAIGRVYAANTLGSILGVVLMVHTLIPVMGVRLGLTLAALIDALLGLYLLRMLSPARVTASLVAAAACMVLAMGISIQLGQVDPRIQASGVFRTGEVRFDENSSVPFLKDGKTATVALHQGKSLSIITNGKPDAALTAFDRPPTGDEITMVMLGVMPLIAHPAPRDIAVIGWGSGLSTHTLLGSAIPRSVDTIEIEEVMYDAARAFGPRVARAYEDPRSHVHIDDARTFLSTGRRQYDVIISEPSNPWVNGVANLFTAEFYRFMKRHLREDGMLVQWLHTYEISDPLVSTMLAALVSEFPGAEIYTINDGDMLILAPKGKLSTPFGEAPWSETALRAELSRVGLGHPDEIALRRIGSAEVIRQYVKLFSAAIHSDYYPSVALEAPRTRYQGQSADFLSNLVVNGLPVLDMLDCRKPLGSGAQNVIDQGISVFSRKRSWALQVTDTILQERQNDTFKQNALPADISIQRALSLVRQTASLDTPAQVKEWSAALATLATSIGVLPAEDLREVWTPAPAWLPASVAKHPVAAALLRVYAATAARNPRAMLDEAESLLAMPEANDLAPASREEIHTIAMLGALGTGDNAKALALGNTDPGNLADNLAAIQSYLMAWADSGTPACMARTAEH